MENQSATHQLPNLTEFNMQIQEIEVLIDQHGQVQLLVRGVKGAACLEITKELEMALGSQVTSREWTGEAYETDAPPLARQIRQHLR